ncbi:hypothetical protein KP509_02G046900 [Ceratopteris richardii]|nr:hypothetical protein KP509_02G046900 [Ceratopteris richardii]
MIERILLHLPVSSSIRLASVSKSWYSSVRSSSLMKFGVARTHPFLYLWGLHPRSLLTLACMYDPILQRWFTLNLQNKMNPVFSPSCSLTSTRSGTLILYPSGICSSDSVFLRFAPNPVNIDWSMSSAATNQFLFFPFVAALDSQRSPSSSFSSFVVFVLGELRNAHTVQLYDSATDSWEVCPSPMAMLGPFRFMGSFHVSSAVVGRKVYIVNIHTGVITYFNLGTKSWNPLRKLEGKHMQHFLLSSTGRGLYALGLYIADQTNECVKLLKVNEITMQYKEVSQMPEQLWSSLIDHFKKGTHPLLAFSYLRCTGSGNLIYVYSGSYFSKMRFCVCDIEDGYRWHQLPVLPADLEALEVRSECCSFQLMPEVCLKSRFVQ